MQSHEIRKTFVEFFARHGHVEVASSSLIPHNDPTVLLTTAGMQQMTPYFLGLEEPPASRMTSIQKCFRAVGKDDDVLEVGDSTHLTFFEMLGNFSVGDYFKPEAIDMAWELVTGPFQLNPEAIWVTVHPTDDYSPAYWRDQIGIPEHKIQTDPENFWGPVGDSGPCGPNSEIYVDLLFDERGDDGRGPMSEDEDRYVEIWNLVFMELYQNPDGSTRALEQQNVDTGMGLERISMVLQDKRSIYDTDLFRPIIDHAAGLADISYGDDPVADHALRIIADHSRGVTFLIADGVMPSNEGRGYVLRRILRRAIQKARSLGVDEPLMGEIADLVVVKFGDQYPELRARRSEIQRIIQREEAAFDRTLSVGMNRFETLLESLAEQQVSVIPGEEAFRLHDTYGFPIDLTVELAATQGYQVDLDGFREALEAQRKRSRDQLDQFADESRKRAPLYAQLAPGHSVFTGYETTAQTVHVVAIFGADARIESAQEGEPVEVVLDETPFYGESGGQIGDTGEIVTETGRFRVDDTQKPSPELIVHRGEVTEGYIEQGQRARAGVDVERRMAIRRNHTATHLLHAALRQVLGSSTQQAGSLVAPDRLRFDFTTQAAPDATALTEIARIANAQVLEDAPVQVTHESHAEAVERGAMALFGEKYGDTVRVVEVPGYSIELCGGTHVDRTGQIGPIVITSESSIGSGVRRIDAITGDVSLNYLSMLHGQSEVLSQELRAPVDQLSDAVAQLEVRLKEQEHEIERLRVELAASDVDQLLDQVTQVDGTAVLATQVNVPNRDTLLTVADRLRDRLQSGVLVLGAEIDERPALLAMVTPDQVERGLSANDIVREIAPIVGGRGGGRPALAQGGGSDPAALGEALGAVAEFVKKQVVGATAS